MLVVGYAGRLVLACVEDGGNVTVNRFVWDFGGLL